MYIVAIAWLYLTLLMAASEPSWVRGMLTFVSFGLGPLAIFLWIVGTPQRRRNRQRGSPRGDEANQRPDAPSDVDAKPPNGKAAERASLTVNDRSR